MKFGLREQSLKDIETLGEIVVFVALWLVGILEGTV